MACDYIQGNANSDLNQCLYYLDRGEAENLPILHAVNTFSLTSTTYRKIYCTALMSCMEKRLQANAHSPLV